MKKLFVFLMVLGLVIGGSGLASAMVMTVDSGPWYLTDTAWFNSAKTDTVNGTFTNLRTGTYPGTNYVDPVDFLNDSTVYVGGPKLLYWLYYIPNVTVASIQAGDLLQTKLVIDWDGVEYALAPDHMNWVDNNDSAWLAAGAMENYTDVNHTGVVGQIRFSWSLASMGASSVEEYRASVLDIQTLARGEVRYRNSPTADWQSDSLQVNVVSELPSNTVPEPATMLLLGLGLIGLAGARRKLKN